MNNINHGRFGAVMHKHTITYTRKNSQKNIKYLFMKTLPIESIA